jgi:plasmid stabilization system protein ParE
MQVRWSPESAEDLSRIVACIRLDSLAAAQRVAKTIYAGAAALRTFPHRGRIGRVEGTRELSLPPLPFVIVYRVLPEAVEISNVIHGARRWP